MLAILPSLRSGPGDCACLRAGGLRPCLTAPPPDGLPRGRSAPRDGLPGLTKGLLMGG